MCTAGCTILERELDELQSEVAHNAHKILPAARVIELLHARPFDLYI
jgi:hypothetical protein